MFTPHRTLIRTSTLLGGLVLVVVVALLLLLVLCTLGGGDKLACVFLVVVIVVLGALVAVAEWEGGVRIGVGKEGQPNRSLARTAWHSRSSCRLRE